MRKPVRGHRPADTAGPPNADPERAVPSFGRFRVPSPPRPKSNRPPTHPIPHEILSGRPARELVSMVASVRTHPAPTSVSTRITPSRESMCRPPAANIGLHSDTKRRSPSAAACRNPHVPDRIAVRFDMGSVAEAYAPSPASAKPSPSYGGAVRTIFFRGRGVADGANGGDASSARTIPCRRRPERISAPPGGARPASLQKKNAMRDFPLRMPLIPC